LLNYSLSNSLDDIKIAVYARIGININLDKVKWEKNQDLSISVKHLMNKHHVSFSMTTYFNKKNIKNFVINMRVGDNWFITGFYVIDGKYYSWDFFDAFEKIKRFLEDHSIDPKEILN